jgi:BirA family biotin operon repressor/biotin-[acetyl-CoA-carboxylase] ligase
MDENTARATRRQVLDALAEGPVTGPTLAERLDVSRTAVWKHVEALREAGFGVESDDDGYRVTEVPEYGADAIAYGLDAPFAVEFHETLDSTNRRARELAGEGASDMAVIAERQTGGQGRLDREWSSPPGGVYTSLVLRPDLPPAQVPVYTLAAAVATTRAARELGVEAGIKWPNDVLVGAEERKLAGILTGMEGEADRVSWVVVGVGVNANVEPADLPETGTSLAEQVGEVDRSALLRRLLAEFDDLRADPESVLPAWRDLSLTLGERVRVETPGGVVEGEAVDVEFPGSLLVATDDGEARVTAGDCEHLRPV